MSNIELTQEVIKDLKKLADSLETLITAVDDHNEKRGKTNSSAENPEIAAENSKIADDTSPTSEPSENQPTLEEVRAFLAEKNRDGHREAIKAILTKYGAEKLTSLDPSNYAAVLKEAEELK